MQIATYNQSGMYSNGNQGRYKSITKLERDAQQQLEGIVDRYDSQVIAIPESIRLEVMPKLTGLAQRSILNALESRLSTIDESIGYDWPSVLDSLNNDSARAEIASSILEKHPRLVTILSDSNVQQRNQIEWLYDQTASRFEKHTPYISMEDMELSRWKAECPIPYQLAEMEAAKVADRIVTTLRQEPSGMASTQNNTDFVQTRKLATLAAMISARKLYMAATEVNEFYEGASSFVDVSVPANLQHTYNNKLYVRLGTKVKPFIYRQPTDSQLANYKTMLGSPMLNNLQEKIMPWTSKKGLGQKITPELMGAVYNGIISKPKVQDQVCTPVLDRLNGDMQLYKTLGFRSDLNPAQSAIFEGFLKDNGALTDLLNLPSTQHEFQVHRVDTSIVELCLNATIAETVINTARLWKPDIKVTGSNRREQARCVLPVILKDMVLYHNDLYNQDYLAVRNSNHFKTILEKEYEVNSSPKERSKRQSFYNNVAVSIVAKESEFTSPIPKDWEDMGSYVDPVTNKNFTDYKIKTPAGTGIVCLIQGGNPTTGQQTVADLLDLNKPALINDSKSRIKGVRVSELFYNELRTSCLQPRSIARTQFYTSFSMAESLNMLKGNTDEPTMEMIVEALKPCSMFRYSEDYCRIKPSEMVRVKYRTPAGEANNPCWDASASLGSLQGQRMQERHTDTKWSLLLIEGEKKAAMLAQMMQDKQLPIHVIAIPGVWMAIKGPKGQRELSEFFDPFVMKDAAGNQRKCLVFFDNDKAYNINVTQAMIETAACMQKQGAHVFIPNLPFGKKIKGADDFAQVYCVKAGGLDYKPLEDIINQAVLVENKKYTIVQQTALQQRDVKCLMQRAENIHELQQSLKKSADPINATEFKQLALLQAPYLQVEIAKLTQPSERIVAGNNETKVTNLLNNLDVAGKQNLLALMLNSNKALTSLQNQMIKHIPNFNQGITFAQFDDSKVAQDSKMAPVKSQPDKIMLTPDLFA